MKRPLIALVMVSAVMILPLSAKAQSDNDQTEALLRAMQATANQDEAESTKKSAQLNKAVNEKITGILKFYKGPQTRAAFKKALHAWLVYQKAMGEAVEISFAEGGGHGGPAAATHCNLMTEEDFLKTLNEFLASD
ncbi:hypothetical protein GS501_05125 [Saccharibacter sp. 17.LH.SD]|uniref:hypothetical protein n=1 Tax=Saccharibacter sp. 17.LH.SD TaxID=2689393 RepID=UPI00136B21DD|nr:hypothetical protein [Saccharibacter sp. 17.LH.SD]MXV44430.1 hypothetical protein [Saccharibacter sp. 17.LH.SD]